MAGTLWSEPIYRAIGDSLSLGIWVCDPAGTPEFVSDAFLDLLGRSLSDVRRSGWFDLVVSGDRPSVQDAWQVALATGGDWDQRYRLHSGDGRIVEVQSRGAPVRDTQGAVVAWAGVHLEVGELERAHLQLQQLHRVLQDMLALTPTLFRGESVGEVMGRVCEAARQVLHADSCAIWELGNDTASLVWRSPPSPLYEPGQQIPLTGLERVVAGLRAQQTVMATVDDPELTAIERDYLHRLEVEAAARLPFYLDGLEDWFLALTYRDARMATDIDHRALWRRFTDLAALSLLLARRQEERRREALELNDSVTQALASALVASELNDTDSATLRIRTALHAAQQLMSRLVGAAKPGSLRRETAPPRLEPPVNAEAPVPSQTVTYRVLLADDSDDYRLLLRTVLEADGFEIVDEARDGREALAAAGRSQPDLIVLDLAMPQMDGLQALPELHARAPNARVLVVSGFAASDLAMRACALGAVDYLDKGARVSEIIAAARDVVGRPPT